MATPVDVAHDACTFSCQNMIYYLKNIKNQRIILYLVRYVGSALLLVFSMVVTFYAILEQKTGFWREVPGR
jgi:hypothetical protein